MIKSIRLHSLLFITFVLLTNICSSQIQITEVKISISGVLEHVYLQVDQVKLCIDAYGNIHEIGWIYETVESFEYDREVVQDIIRFNDTEIEYEDGRPIRIGDIDVIYHAFHPYKILQVGHADFEYEYDQKTGGQLVRISGTNFNRRYKGESRLESIGGLEIEYDYFRGWISTLSGDVSEDIYTQITINQTFEMPTP